jgi:predicted permease
MGGRLRDWLTRGRRRRLDPDADLAREIEAHLALEVEEQVGAGLAPGPARTAALRAFGNPRATREAASDQRRIVWLDTLRQDAQFAWRQIRRAPAFAATATLLLALGIGANTAIFSVINGFLRPLPVPEADRIVVVAAIKLDDPTGLRYEFSFPALEEYRRSATVFSDILAYDVRFGGITVQGKTTSFVSQGVTGNFFSGLGVVPAAGRLLVPGEGEHESVERILVLGHSFWERRFGADPGVVGSIVRIDGMPTRIIGVAPKGFRGLFEGVDMEGYVPIGRGIAHVSGREYLTNRSHRNLTMVARLRAGASIEQAQAAVEVIASRLAAAHPATEGDTTVRVIPEPLARPIPLTKWVTLLPLLRAMLLTLAGVVLLIACMNVANLQLVRAMARQREMAVRAALGSGRSRLVRLLLVESSMLAIGGTALGLLAGATASSALARSIQVGFEAPTLLDFGPDWRLFVYAAIVAAATTLSVGALPAWRASRAQVADLLHDGGRAASAGAGRQRTTGALVIAQIAGSALLLIVAGVFVRTLQQAQRIDLGFDPASVTTARLDPANLGYSRERGVEFYEELARRLASGPGVEQAANSFSQPLGYIFGGYDAYPVSSGRRRDDAQNVMGCNSVTPEFFTLLRIPIVRGRVFDDRDDIESPRVAIVNEQMAQRFWPGQDPLGQQIVVPETGPAPWQIVGIARMAKYYAVFEPPMPYFYLPQAQNPSLLRMVYVRSSRPSEEVAAFIEQTVRAIEPDLPIADLRSYTRGIAGNFGVVLFRAGAIQATAMGVLGLILAVVGMYGLVSYRTAQRSREIGIRLALGAQPRDVRGIVLRQGVAVAAWGIAIGLALAGGFVLVLDRLVMATSSLDLLTFGGVAGLLAATALVASDIPARRATRTDPVVVLRHEG